MEVVCSAQGREIVRLLNERHDNTSENDVPEGMDLLTVQERLVSGKWPLVTSRIVWTHAFRSTAEMIY